MAEQLAEERHDLDTGDVAHVEIEVQPEAVATRGHGQRRDDRDLVTPITMPKVRSVPDGRPGLAHVGNQEKPAFVEEHEMGAPACGVFLNWAIRSASIGRWPPTPLQTVPQQRPYADRAVVDAEPLADDFTDAPESPQLGGVPGRAGATE